MNIRAVLCGVVIGVAGLGPVSASSSSSSGNNGPLMSSQSAMSRALSSFETRAERITVAAETQIPKLATRNPSRASVAAERARAQVNSHSSRTMTLIERQRASGERRLASVPDSSQRVEALNASAARTSAQLQYAADICIERINAAANAAGL